MSAPEGTPRSVRTTFAPLAPGGPLPPGVTGEVIAAVYRRYSSDLKPKKILRLLGRKVPSIASVDVLRQDLRRAFDNPQARAGKPQEGLPPLYEVLYSWAREQEWAQSAYDAVVAPAEVTREDQIFLDPTQFGQLVGQHFPALPGPTPTGPDPDAHVKAISLFVLAFGLLQPSDASALVRTATALDPAIFLLLWHPGVRCQALSNFPRRCRSPSGRRGDPSRRPLLSSPTRRSWHGPRDHGPHSKC